MDALAAYPTSFRQGRTTENLFRASALAAGHAVREASLQMNRSQHIDYAVQLDGVWRTVDVKGTKRLHRYGDLQHQYVCLELHGAGPENLGWLFGGKAQLIAFEQPECFVLVWRRRLAEAARFLVTRELVDTSAEAIHKVYARRDSELITWVDAGVLRSSWLLFGEIRKVV